MDEQQQQQILHVARINPSHIPILLLAVKKRWEKKQQLNSPAQYELFQIYIYHTT